MHRMEYLMSQVERAIAERFVKQVVGGCHRPDERVFNRQTPGLGAALANSSHYILDVPTRQGFEVGPPASGSGFTERSVRALNGNTHEHAP
jgi:hypothetical protein